MGNIRDERFRTGNRCKVYLRGDGTPQLLGEGFVGALGEGSQLTANVQTGAHDVHVLGDAEPQDIVDGLHSYQVSLRLLMLVSTRTRDIVQAQRVTIEVIDKFDANKVTTCEGAHLQSGSFEVSAGQLVGRNLQFQCMRIH